MPDRIKKISIVFASFSFLFFLGSMFVNRDSFETIAYDNVFWYQTRQFLAILLLFGIGFFFLHDTMKRLPAKWLVLYAFPMGACLWAFVSLSILLTGVPYSLPLTLCLLVLLLAAAHIIRARRFDRARDVSRGLFGMHRAGAVFLDTAPLCLLLFGLACLASSGFVYTFVSYDSYFYFITYGHTLTITGNFREIVGDNSYTLTNISQFLPLLNAYVAFWGLDQCFQLQAFLTADTAVCFFCGLSEFYLHARTHGSGAQPDTPLSADGGSDARRAALFAALFTLLLLSSTSFLTISSWTLANMYCMVYSFLLFLAFFLVSRLQYDAGDGLVLISFWMTALTQLRKDGVIFAAFFLICLCMSGRFSKRRLSLCFLPAAISEAVWLFYVRVVLSAKVSQAAYSSIANDKNIFFVCCILIGCALYVWLMHDLLKRLEQKIPALTESIVLLAGMLLLLAASAALKDLNTIVDNVDFVIRNMFRYPSSWGVSGLAFGALLALSFVPLPRLDELHFIWIGYSLLNLVSYCLVDSKWFWLNWDDSYNRVLLQIVPVFVFLMAVKILPLLRFGTPDRSSGSSSAGAR